MKRGINYGLLTVALLFSLIAKAQEPPSSENYNYNTFEAQKKWIVGTFLADEDHNTELTFTKDGRCIWKYLVTKDTTDNYTYTLKFSTQKASTPSGHFNIYTLYLKAVPADPNEDLTYEMYTDDSGLVLYPWGRGGRFLFSRVKPKEPAAAAPKKEEVKPVESKQTASQAYVAGEQDCLLGRAFGESLENQGYSSNYLQGWEKARCPL